MGKKGFSLFDSYMASMSMNDAQDTADLTVPMPDSMRTSTLIEQIGKDRGWTDDQVQSDVDILQKNRLYYVRDLRSLSDHSWTVLEILPLVRDLLRQAAGCDKAGASSPLDAFDSDEEKKKKKEKKKDKKDKKKKKLGVPVQPSVLMGGKDEVALAEHQDLLATSPEIMDDVLSQDPETIRNTIRNGSVDLGKDFDEGDVQSPPMHPADSSDDASKPKKTVSFSSHDGMIPRSNGTTTGGTLVDSSDESSTSSSSSSSSDDDESTMKNKKTKEVNASSSSSGPKTFGARPIQAVSANRIRVKTATGDVYECDRFCPHKGVDLTTWGQVIGNTLVCSKHDWRFNLAGNGMGNKGRTVHPCKVNDW
ncbi:hypothetical protein BC940DRAFT_288503 [Gongronella butleri]|nr:hypothetical protein BC940DRAFT_288503 [Gongronella butleri]